MNRRHLLQAAVAMPVVSQAQPTPPRPLHLLILGGTGLTGPHQVRYALSRGHRVTLFNRGRRPQDWPAAVEELVGDREKNDFTSLQGRRFDVCIDNPSSVPHWVSDAAAVLKGQVGHFVCISTISVYASDAEPGQDETAARHAYDAAQAASITMAQLRQNMALYGPMKSATEDEARRQFAGRCSVIRPGLIAGPGDETDRFSYWPLRAALGGDALAPPADNPASWIDARDLAEWTIRVAEQRLLGDFNAVGDAISLQDLLAAATRAATPSHAEASVRWQHAPAAFLEANKVAPWSDLPVWVPGSGETAGFHRRRNQRAKSAGLSFRGAEQTCADVLAWWAKLPEARRLAGPRAGLKADRERELLALLQVRSATQG